MDDDEEDVPTCPLCLEELDATDRAVRACHCGYQLCLLCLNYIREQNNPRCPACRTPYEEHNFHIEAVNPEQAAKEAKERKTARKERERREKMKEIEKERARAIVLSQQKAKNNLKHARILQRNLVYVIGLSLTLAREEVIRRVDMFGKFGRMMRILVNRSHPFNADAPGGPSISAYVQYVRDSDALSAVRSMNNAVFDGREIRCAIATTKYCDSLLRNAQACDPSGTFHCGNTQCMYYHSTTHSETVLTKEEVLARQLGPPPPAHLFQPPSNRRPHFMPNPRMPQPNLSTPGASAGRPIPSRPQINPVSNPPSNAPVIHPPSGPLASSSFAVGPSEQPSFASSPPPASPTLSSGVVSRVPSFHRSPPISPEIRRAPRLPTSPNFVDPAGSASASTDLVGPVAAAATANASAAWASTQPGHPITRTPTRRSPAPTDDPARPRLVVARRARADAPPGFESAAPSKPQASAPLRPPGFDAPANVLPPDEAASSKETKDLAPTSPERNQASAANTSVPTSMRRENGKAPGEISPPPGFGPPPKARPNVQEVSTEETAAAWSQEASSDQVFSGNERRPTSAIGQVGARNSAAPTPVSNTATESPAELAKVLASIGGTLGVSSEFRTVQPGAAQQFDPLGRRPGGVPVSNTPKSQPDGQAGQFGPLFGAISHSQSTTALPTGTRRATNTPASPTLRNPNHSMDGMSSPRNMGSTPARIPPAYLRAHVPAGMRPNTSRFGFARERMHEASPKPRPPASPATFQNLFGKNVLDKNISVHTASNDRVVPTNDMVGLNVTASPGAVPTANRQQRSRFMFADTGSSPIRDDPGIEENVEIKLGPTPDGGLGQGPGGIPLSDEVYGEVFANLSTKEKLDSLFTHAKWAPDSLPPMPHDSQVDEMMQQSNGPGPDELPRDAAELRGNANSRVAAMGGAERSHAAVGAASRGRGRHVQAPPPGFRGATPGISPETTAADKKSASTGVATKVVSGGALPKGSKTEITTTRTCSNAEEVTSSGAESLEEEAKKNRGQRKRDRRERGKGNKHAGKALKDTSEGKSVKSEAARVAELVEAVSVTNSEESESKGDKGEEKEWKSGGKGKTVSAVKEQTCEAPHPVVESTVAVSASGLADEAREDKSVGAGTAGDVARNVNVPGDDGDKKAGAPRTEGVTLVVGDADLMGSDEDVGPFMSVSDLEREVELARGREAKLKDRLEEITRRIESYDNVQT